MEVWEVHDLVYHYTTLSGLKGILESQSLYATNFAFLNDSREIHQIRPRLEEAILTIATKLCCLRLTDSFGGRSSKHCGRNRKSSAGR